MHFPGLWLLLGLLSGVAAMSLKKNIKFVKYQGLGNDFILVDNTRSTEPLCDMQEAVKICNRNFGIGGDGVIFALPGTNGCDYTMKIYNNDGSEPQMCGNGIRCMARFIIDEIEKKAPGTEATYNIWTGAGKIVPKVTKDGTITVDMGKPILKPEIVPTTLAATKDGVAIDSPFKLKVSPSSPEYTYKATCVSMGNPHAVMFFDSLETLDPPFHVVGPIIEKHPVFPQRVNAEFIQVLSRSHLLMKVWERGAGPTLACGTGACATVVAGVLSGRCDRTCKVTLPGGDLFIKWDEKDDKIYMTGPAEAVFEGQIAV